MNSASVLTDTCSNDWHSKVSRSASTVVGADSVVTVLAGFPAWVSGTFVDV